MIVIEIIKESELVANIQATTIIITEIRTKWGQICYI
jgi:hypothetical protein